MERGDIGPNTFILDTSVIVKWFSDEDFSDIALKIREKIFRNEIYAVIPELVLYELTNSLRNKKELSREILKEVMNSFVDMRLDFAYPTIEIIENTVDLSYKFEITTYDAYFLALAEQLSVKFITADFKLYEKVKSELDFVIYLPDVVKLLF